MAIGQQAKAVTGAKAGRPRNFDNDKILDRALDLFWKKGFANTTTRDLEVSLELNQSSIYNSFGSKEQFYNLVLDRYESLTNEAIICPLEESEAGLEALTEYFDRLSDWISTDGRQGCMLINMMAEDGRQNRQLADRADRYRKRVHNALKMALERAQVTNEIIAGDNNSRATLLMGLTLGLNIAARTCSNGSEVAELSAAIGSQLKSWKT